MGRRAIANLVSKTVRAKLKPRGKPYFVSISPRLTLGWVRGSRAEAGRWVARVELGRNAEGQAIHRQRTIGLADDIGLADGWRVLTFAQACRLAADPHALVGGALTVARAIDVYTENRRARSVHADRDRARLLSRMPAPLLAEPVTHLTKATIESWRNSLVREGSEEDRRRSQDTANRLLTILRAALNYVYADDANNIASDSAWRRVAAFEGVGRPREIHFSEAEIARWIEAAQAISPALANLIAAGYYTGARAGELLALNVEHIDLERAQLRIAKGKTGPRVTLLAAEALAFFSGIASGRARTEPLLLNADGERWARGGYARGAKAALQAAVLDPQATFYSLRHSHVSRRIERGQPLTLIAGELGTSVLMLERTYSKYLQETRRALVEAGAPTLKGGRGGS